MASIRSLRVPSVVLAGTLVVLVGCGGSDDAVESAATAAVAPSETAAAPIETDPEPVDTVAAPVETDPEVESPSAGGITIVLDDGRSWALESEVCTFNPDAAGAAAAVLNLAGANSDGVELNAIEAWPLDGTTDEGTAFLANFVDENDELFILVDHSITSDGGSIVVTADYHNNVMYQLDDPPVGVAVITCTT